VTFAGLAYVTREYRGTIACMSTVGRMERLEKFMAVNDIDGDVHYVRTSNTRATLCGMVPAASSSGEVTCYRCHEFALGTI
jgi:hypothetical protein